MSKRRNYNQDFFKVGGSPQPGDETVPRRQKRRLAGAQSDRLTGREDLAAKMGQHRDQSAGADARAAAAHTHTTEKEEAMPSAWSRKDERMYRHIKQSSRSRGVGKDRAEEIAARTVNQHRREEGRTPNKQTEGTGNPNHSLEDRTVAELRNRASELEISGRSKMNKKELVRAIRDEE